MARANGYQAHMFLMRPDEWGALHKRFRDHGAVWFKPERTRFWDVAVEEGAPTLNSSLLLASRIGDDFATLHAF